MLLGFFVIARDGYRDRTRTGVACLIPAFDRDGVDPVVPIACSFSAEIECEVTREFVVGRGVGTPWG